MRRHILFLWLVLPGSVVQSQENPRFSIRIEGPCGQTLESTPGSRYDDGTGGADLFFDREIFALRQKEVPNNRPGVTWDVILTTTDNNTSDGAMGWSWSLAVEGAIRITDVTTVGTAGCLGGRRPECRVFGGFEVTEFTGPPGGAGPQTEENRGATSFVVLKPDGFVMLPPEGTETIAKTRVFAEFPSREGGTVSGRLFFTERTGSMGVPVGPMALWHFLELTPSEGNPELETHDCEVTFKTVAPIADFVRCDPNDSGEVNLADAIWIFNELFRGGTITACPAAADCDGDGSENITDAIYALEYSFRGGPPPPPPFPECGGLDDLERQGCPLGSTRCP